ncbi:YopX family protein [Fusobacterium varium]|uniref:YopX family protein n=1 Tax=Fusobacterium varium TaxID=856 RepID=UPI0022E56149|nr:YopX family protein [Fusobacterium varium]
MKNYNLRLWDKKAKKMIKIEELSRITLEKVFKKYKLIRSTGFFDKNNSEIFEGDILKIQIENTFCERKLLCRYGKFKKKIIGIDKKRHKAEIKGFYFVSDTFDILLPIIRNGISDTQKMEKIGNIYENPNLMGW